MKIIHDTITALSRNGFDVHFTDNVSEVKKTVFENIFKDTLPQSVSYGYSSTLMSTKILEEIKANKDIKFIDSFDRNCTPEENMENRREALLCDVFFAGSNAITQDGKIMNLDMVGNRIGGIIFGPRKVVLVAGINKIVKDIDEGYKRIKTISAMKNSMANKHLNLPCTKVGYCVDCNNTKRLCNSWSIIEKSYPKKRISIVLINEEAGY